MDIATYYLFTGDLRFVRTEWPAITRELAWNQSQVDGRGLLITNRDDGLDWDYYDGPKTGAVTAYNAIYVETLTGRRRSGRRPRPPRRRHFLSGGGRT